MDRYFVVVSGLPASGKSTVGQKLASALGLTLIDKDITLERLFKSKGVGDAEWRRALSRESNLILQTEATASQGAVLVSHWHLPGMSLDSGTVSATILQLERSKLMDSQTNVNYQCPECGAPMEKGFTVHGKDKGRNSTRAEFRHHWCQGVPKYSSFWGFLVTSGKAMYPIAEYRCTKCGFLKSYAL